MNLKTGVDCSTLKWMRHLLPSNALSNTLTDMLIEKEKSKPFLLRILEDKNALQSIVRPNSRFPFLHNDKTLKPELLFQKTTLEKIRQLRDIFLQFDEDHSRTLEISELFTMFNTNGIPVTKDELIDLFTLRDQKKKKIWEYKLTFLDFVNFSLSEECEAKYRLLMKKVKQRTNSDIYLPMTLKQTLEHIFNKGKIKLNIAKINKGINKLEKIEKRKELEDSNTDKSKYLILRKIGINRGININMICKSFSNVLNISKEQLEQMETQIRNNTSHSVNRKKTIELVSIKKKEKNTIFNVKRIKNERTATDYSTSTYYKTEKDNSIVMLHRSVQPFAFKYQINKKKRISSLRNYTHTLGSFYSSKMLTSKTQGSFNYSPFTKQTNL